MIARHFVIQELVDRDTFGTMGEKAWGILNPDAVIALDGVRDFFNRPVTVNNWHTGGEFQYRGYRPPYCQIGAPESYHRRGMAFDFDVEGINASIVRNMIVQNQNDQLLHRIQRLEANVPWVHMDIGVIPMGRNRIYVFNA
jgi:hypothetical protein